MPRATAEVVPVLTHVRALLAEMDLRYQQRYDASSKALDAALLAAEKAVQTALTAAEKAVTKAETAAEKRFDAVNEFRAAYQDIISNQMPRAEAEQRLATMAKELDELKAYRNRGAGAMALWGYLVAGLGVALAVVAFVAR